MGKNHFTLTPLEGNKTKIKIIGKNKLFANGIIHPNENQNLLNVVITNYDYSPKYLRSKIRDYLVNEEGISSDIRFNLLQVDELENTLAFLDDGNDYEEGEEYSFEAGEKENYFVDGILKCDPEAVDYDFDAYFIQTTFKFCAGIRLDFNVFEIK